MSTAIAIIVGAVIIAAAVVGAQFVPRYQFAAVTHDNAVRLDSRTGEIARCRAYMTGVEVPPKSGHVEMAWLCENTFTVP